MPHLVILYTFDGTLRALFLKPSDKYIANGPTRLGYIRAQFRFAKAVALN